MTNPDQQDEIIEYKDLEEEDTLISSETSSIATKKKKNLLALICDHSSLNSSCENEEEEEEEETNFIVIEAKKIYTKKQYIKSLRLGLRLLLPSGRPNIFYEESIANILVK